MFPLEFREMLDHITGIVQVKLPASYVSVGKINHEVYQKAPRFFSFIVSLPFLSCPQKDSAEHEEYVGARSVGNREVGEQDGAYLLEKILDRDNLNRAYKRVRANEVPESGSHGKRMTGKDQGGKPAGRPTVPVAGQYLPE